VPEACRRGAQSQEIEPVKSIPVDTSQLRFLVASLPEQVVDFETKLPKTDRDGQPIHSVDVLVSGEGRKGELVSVKLHGAAPKVSEGERVMFKGLVAMPWSNNGRTGISYSAAGVQTAKAAA
jgi:hypothetical protein